MVQAVYENYSGNPKQFVDRIDKMGLNKPLGLPFQGEGIPSNTTTWSDKSWNGQFHFHGWLLDMELLLHHCKH